MQLTPTIESTASTAPLETCGACGRKIGRLEQPFIWGEHIVCFGCHRDLEQAPAGEDVDAAATVAEYRFFSDENVRVTRKRVVINRAVYRVSQIRFARLQKTGSRRVYAVATALAGLTLGVIGLNRHLDGLDISLLVAGSALLITGLSFIIARRPTFSIHIGIDDSEKSILSTRNSKYAAKVLNAIGEAIVERGQFVIRALPPAAGDQSIDRQARDLQSPRR
jgi:hypothetical protein